MKNTVESSLQAMVEKTQERQAHSTPTPTLPVTTPLPTISHPPPPSEHPPPQQRSSRRSCSHRHRSSSRRHDKRPISVHRSPRRRRPTRRPGAHRDLDLPPEMCPLAERYLDDEIGSDQSLFDRPPHTIEKHDTRPRSIINHSNTPPPSQLFKLHLGGQINRPPPTLIPRIDLTTRNSRPTTSGSHGESGRTIPRTLPHHTNPTGLTTNNPLLATTLHMILPPNRSRHFPPPIQHHHATSRRNLPTLGTTGPQPPSMSLQDICSSTYRKDPKRNGSAESSSVSAIQSACQQHQKSHLRRKHDQQRQLRLRSSNVLLRRCKRWTLEFQLRSPGKKSTSFSARIFSLSLTWRSLTSFIYLPLTCLHSSFHFQSPVTSTCHLL